MNTGLFPATLNNKQTVFVSQYEFSIMAERLNRCTGSTWNNSTAQEMPRFQGTQRYVTLFREARFWTHSMSVTSSRPRPSFQKYISAFSTNLCLSLPDHLRSSEDFQTKFHTQRIEIFISSVTWPRRALGLNKTLMDTGIMGPGLEI
jgi:hypothetical protein